MSRGLPAADGQVILVDDEDYEILSQYVWHVDSEGCIYRLHYLGKKKIKTAIHQHILSVEKGLVIVHIDGNRLDWTRQNLKLVDRATARKDTRRGAFPCRGVVKLRNGMYRAQLHWGMIQIVIGFFESEADASAAYSIWAWQNRNYFIPNHSANDPELTRVRAELNSKGFYEAAALSDNQRPKVHRKFRGIKFDRHAKTHIAIIGFGRRKIKLGKRKMAAEAAKLYDAAAVVRFGEKAKLNFPYAKPEPEYIAKAQTILTAI